MQCRICRSISDGPRCPVCGFLGNAQEDPETTGRHDQTGGEETMIRGHQLPMVIGSAAGTFPPGTPSPTPDLSPVPPNPSALPVAPSYSPLATPAAAPYAPPPSAPAPPPRRRFLVPLLVAGIVVLTGALIAALALPAFHSPGTAGTPSNPVGPATPAASEPSSPPTSAPLETPTTPQSTPSQSDNPTDVLVAESFSDGTLPADWDVIAGSWTVNGGRLQCTTGDARARIAFGPVAPQNYRIDALVRFVRVANGSRWLNIGLDYHADADWGAVLVARSATTAANGIELAQRKHGATAKYLSDPTGPARAPLGVGQDHWISIEVRGHQIEVEIDGEIAFSADNLTRTGGRLGFVINNATVQFDDVKVTQL